MRILLANYDNDSALPQPCHGLAYLASAARTAGHEVSIWDAGVTHAPPEDLAQLVDDTRPDVVGIGVIGGWWQYRQLVALTNALRRTRHKPWLVLGGHGPVPDPTYFMRLTGAHAVFLGEAETSFVRWLEDPRGGVIPSIPTHPDALSYPAWDLFDMSVYTRTPYPRKNPTTPSATVLSGRGCTHSCSFCFRLEPGFRPRKAKDIAREVEWVKREWRVGYVNLDDELLVASAPRTLEVCEAIGSCDVSYMCNGRVNVLAGARGEEVLRVMRESGCVFVNLGIESLDDSVLREMNKRQTAAQSRLAVERCLSAGISPGLNVLWGSPNDSLESLDGIVEFLLEYDDGAQVRTIRPTTPYPGSGLFARAVREGKLRDVADFYERAHVNSDLATVQWTGLPDAEFHAALLDANTRLLENYHAKSLKRQTAELERLYSGRDTEWRGTRHT